MSPDVVTLFDRPPGFRSSEVAGWMAGLDDQHRRLLAGVQGITPAELEWQAAPGTNTIGMLLAHVAVAETHMTDVGLAGLDQSRVRELLGLATDDDGLPLPEGGRPPAVLAGRALPFYEDLLAKARAHAREVAAGIEDADLERQIIRARPDGSRRLFDLRWMLYHMLEHAAGHHAQVLLLRHLHRVRTTG